MWFLWNQTNRTWPFSHVSYRKLPFFYDDRIENKPMTFSPWYFLYNGRKCRVDLWHLVNNLLASYREREKNIKSQLEAWQFSVGRCVFVFCWNFFFFSNWLLLLLTEGKKSECNLWRVRICGKMPRVVQPGRGHPCPTRRRSTISRNLLLKHALFSPGDSVSQTIAIPD